MISTLQKPNAIARSWLPWVGRGARGLGIDIGQHQTKVVRVEHLPGRPLQAAMASIPTRSLTAANRSTESENPDATMAGGAAGEATDADAGDRRQSSQSAPQDPSLASWSRIQIQQLVRHIECLVGNQRRLPVNVALSMSACDYRTVHVPKETRLTTTTLQQMISQATGDRQTRCFALLPNVEKETGDKPQSRIRCLSIPESVSWSIAEELDRVGLAPRAIDGLPWCLANALRLTANSGESGLEVALDWGFGKPTLVSVSDGVIDYVRCLSSGGMQDLSAQAVAAHQFSLPEAVRWLSQCMSAAGETEPLATTREARRESHDHVLSCVRNLAYEIKIAMDFIRWRNKNARLDRLCLMGGTPQLPGLVELLAAHLQVDVYRWELPAENLQLSSDYATATSLALQGARYA